MISRLPFEQRACFIAGQAKSGTTLLVALLDNHPELLVLPEETAYFPTVLTKYAPRGRRAQFDYLTKQSLSNVLFGGPCKWGKRNYSTFPSQKFLETFEHAAFDPANTQEDLLVLMVKAYAATLERPLDTVARWVEKTPANQSHSGDLQALSTCKNSGHDSRPARHSCGANRTGEDKTNRTVLDLLRDRALAGSCPARQACAGRPGSRF